MPLDHQVVITGRVAADIVRVLVGGAVVPIVDGHYETTVAVSRKVVAITAIDRDGREWTRTIQMGAVAGAVG
jgi:hypothetical protein